jgi:hypothetical protein
MYSTWSHIAFTTGLSTDAGVTDVLWLSQAVWEVVADGIQRVVGVELTLYEASTGFLEARIILVCILERDV